MREAEAKWILDHERRLEVPKGSARKGNTGAFARPRFTGRIVRSEENDLVWVTALAGRAVGYRVKAGQVSDDNGCIL